jgi:predicted AAA+ superfamily ATPase
MDFSMIKYIRNKQIRLIHSISLDFVRDEYLLKLESPNKLVGLIGQRGVGKTTLLLQYLKNNFKATEYLYFSADDVYIINSSIYDIAEEFVLLGGKVIVIDEIHKYKKWAIELKSIYDSFPDLLVRFSGSSMLNILNEKYDLSRRCVTSYVTPLTFREYMKLAEDITLPKLELDDILNDAQELSSSLALENPTLYKHFLRYLQIGFYPFFIEDEVEFKNKLFHALDKIIAEDIPSINKIEYTHLSIFKKFIAKLIYSRVPFSVNISALCKEFEISHPTLSTYLHILEQTKIIQPIRKFSTKISKKPAKLLFSNPNILYAYADEFGIEVDIGTLRETFFASCFEVIYYSDIGDFRVGDYIFEIGGKNKSFKQIKEVPNAYVVVDTDYTMQEHKIPLWLFGLLG